MLVGPDVGAKVEGRSWEDADMRQEYLMEFGHLVKKTCKVSLVISIDLGSKGGE